MSTKKLLIVLFAALGIVLFIVLFAFILLRGSGTAVTDLEPRMCLAQYYEISDQSEVEVVDCTKSHFQEVFAVNDLALGGFEEYPTPQQVAEETTRACSDNFEAYTGSAYGESSYEITGLFPNEEAWTEGDFVIVCVLGNPDKTPLTNSVAETSSA